MATIEEPSYAQGTLPVEVRSVNASNLDWEFGMLRKAIDEKYNHVAFDCEFKLASSNGFIANNHPMFVSPDERYQRIKARVDKGRIRQLGLTLTAEDGSILAWEFNFGLYHFLAEMAQEDTVTCGKDSINPLFFSDLLFASGLLCNPRITWIMFHGAFDIAYFLKLAIFWRPLPESLPEFMSLIRHYFGGTIFDIKYLTKFTNNLFGGLEDVAATMRVKRVVGLAHQGGSDSVLTMHTFQKLKQIYFACDNGMIRHAGIIYGIHNI